MGGWERAVTQTRLLAFLEITDRDSPPKVLVSRFNQGSYGLSFSVLWTLRAIRIPRQNSSHEVAGRLPLELQSSELNGKKQSGHQSRVAIPAFAEAADRSTRVRIGDRSESPPLSLAPCC